ncbi:MAG: DHHA1 domain-containing protein, partial [Acidimicrobiales bacterium]
ALDWHLTRDAALNLYVGLLTDTGRFQYPNTTPDVFVLAEELAGFDLPLAQVTRELFEKHRFAYVRLAGLALARAQLFDEDHLVAAWLTEDELREHDVAFDETEGFIDLLRRTAEAEVVVALKEAPGEGLRVSLRSLGSIDVGAVATELGGGGHAFMAGFTSTASIPETLTQVRAMVAAAPRP